MKYLREIANPVIIVCDCGVLLSKDQIVDDQFDFKKARKHPRFVCPACKKVLVEKKR